MAATLDVVGDKWTLLIVRDLLAGKSRFGEFAASPEGIATNVLTARLQRLVAAGLVSANASSSRVGSYEYSLTARGRSLVPLLQAMRDWGLEHVPGTEARVRVADEGPR